MVRKFVIDTSVFLNPDSIKGFAKNPKQALVKFVDIVKKNREIDVYIPSSIYKELSHFIDNVEILSPYVRVRTPNLYNVYIPAAVIYSFIDEVRDRINKGLRIAEEYARLTNVKAEDIAKLRERYREALRTGIIDSKEDFEAIILSKELDATLVTADEGMINLAKEIGCEFMSPQAFFRFIRE
jgi:RNA ligase partner protein